MILSLFLLLFQAPTGQLDAQQLIDIAPPGSVVTLPTVDPNDPGIYYPRTSLRIDKPLTVLGNGTHTRNLFLDGPGSGEIVLHDFSVEHLHWCQNGCHDTYEWAPHGQYEGAVIASGFDSVRLYDCQVDGRMEVYGNALVLLERTAIGAWDNYPALFAPDATALLFDSIAVHQGGFMPGLGGAGLLFCDRLPSMPDGIPTVQLSQNLTMTGSSRLGGRLDFDWRSFGYGVLWADVGVRAPRAGGGGTWRFLGDTPTFVRLASQAKVPIPARRDLIGLEVTFQATDFGGRYSRPAFALIRP